MSQGVLDVFTEPRKQRLRIISQNEIDGLYGIPCFSDEERKQYFGLSVTERNTLDELKTEKSKMAFLLQLGYFKARHVFPILSKEDVVADIEYLKKRYYPEVRQPSCNISQRTRLKHHDMILMLCSYHSCDSLARDKLQNKARQAASISGKPIYIFRELLYFLQRERIVSPAYSTMQDIIGKALQDEQERMTGILKKRLKSSDIEALDFLLEDVSGISRMTVVKHHPKGFSAMEIKDEI